MTDYATLARIEDHLRRIADALERAHPAKFNPGGYVGGDYTLPEMPLRGGKRVVTREEIRAALATGRESRQADPDETTDDDLGEYPALRCGVYGSPAAARWDDCERPADPLDERDHRPRHDADGDHIHRHGERHWHYYGLEDGACDMEVAMDDPVTLAHYNDHSGPLTFCDCDTIEAENGATD